MKRKSTNKLRQKYKAGSPIQPIVWALVFVLVVVVSLSFRYYFSDTENFIESILIEAHGTVLDIMIFGILFTFINIMTNKRVEIQRYIEEIDDFRHWNESGASYRIAGILRRLNKYKIPELDLSYCNLSKAKLKSTFLENANLEEANLEGADLSFAEMQRVNMKAANLVETDLRIANMQGSDLRMADMSKANLRITNLKGSNLFNVNLQHADMKTVNLEGCDLTTANLAHADLKSAILVDADLSRANLSGADLRSAKMSGCILQDAILEGALLGDFISLVEEEGREIRSEARVTYHQLADVQSLMDAIMPDGEKFNDAWRVRINNDFEKHNNTT